jgi:hypothetical protein
MTTYILAIVLAVGSTLVARGARAGVELSDDVAQPSIHLNVGPEVAGSSLLWSTAVRVHAGASLTFGTGSVRPMVALGGTFAGGSLSLEDRRALRGWLSLDYLEVGPEAQLGVRLVDGGYVDTRIFASMAYLRTDVDPRVRIDPVPGVGTTRGGFRLSVGGNWEDWYARMLARASGRDRGYNALIYLFPQQVEINMERSFGVGRYGVTLGYGI